MRKSLTKILTTTKQKIMKNFILCFSIAATILLSFTACSSDDDDNANPNPEAYVPTKGDKLNNILEKNNTIVVHRVDSIIAKGDENREVLFRVLHHYELTSPGFEKLGFDMDQNSLENFVENTWTLDGRSSQSLNELYFDFYDFTNLIGLDVGHCIKWYEVSNLSITNFKSLLISINKYLDNYQTENTEIALFWSWADLNGINIQTFMNELTSSGFTFDTFFKMCQEKNIDMKTFYYYFTLNNGNIVDLIDYISNLNKLNIGSAVEAANLAWNIYKDNKPVLQLADDELHVYSPQDTDWTDYYGATGPIEGDTWTLTWSDVFKVVIVKSEWYTTAYYDAKSTLDEGGHWIQRFGITASGFCDFGNGLTGSMSNSNPINLGTPTDIIPQVSTNIIITNTSIGIVKSSFVLTGGINGENGIIAFTSN